MQTTDYFLPDWGYQSDSASFICFFPNGCITSHVGLITRLFLAYMDYYHVLGVNKNATEASIRRSFRCRAKLLHPDVNKGTKAKHDFQLANEAYQVLKDTNKRRLYDLRINSGCYSQKVYYRPGQTTHSNPKTYHAYSYSDPPTDYKPTRLEKIFDQFLFFTMLMLGLSVLFYGVYRALGEPVEGVNPYIGIVFGVIFTGIFIFGWDKMQRLNTKSNKP